MDVAKRYSAIGLRDDATLRRRPGKVAGPRKVAGCRQGGYFQVVPFQCKSAVLGLEVV
jgi:hypothetical protein